MARKEEGEGGGKNSVFLGALRFTFKWFAVHTYFNQGIRSLNHLNMSSLNSIYDNDIRKIAYSFLSGCRFRKEMCVN